MFGPLGILLLLLSPQKHGGSYNGMQQPQYTGKEPSLTHHERELVSFSLVKVQQVDVHLHLLAGAHDRASYGGGHTRGACLTQRGEP